MRALMEESSNNNLSPETQGAVRSLRRLTRIAYIVGPISLLLGGVLLSSAGVFCAFAAYLKLKALAAKQALDATMQAALRTSVVRALVLCGIALVLNAVSLYMLYPMMSDYLDSADVSNVSASTVFSGDEITSEPGSQTWG